MPKYYREEYWNDRENDDKPFLITHRFRLSDRFDRFAILGKYSRAIKLTYHGKLWSFSIQRRHDA